MNHIIALTVKMIYLQREKEDALKKILQLERQLDAKQKLELEIQQLKGQLQVMQHMGAEEDSTVKNKIDELSSELNEKIEEMEDMEALNQTLVVKERKSNDELQEARKELVSVRTFRWSRRLSFYPRICAEELAFYSLPRATVVVFAFREPRVEILEGEEGGAENWVVYILRYLQWNKL